jgi:hypothetical protein
MKSQQIISGRVNADMSIAAGSRFSVTKFATPGGYMITFPPGFKLLAIQPTPISAGNVYFAHPSSYTDNSVKITLFTNAGAGIDFPFSFIAIGVAA